ncbi:hypothetical protein [Lentzea albidocapillata]|nr:hypothetical protein [Lentzea albidocapillata]
MGRPFVAGPLLLALRPNRFVRCRGHFFAGGQVVGEVRVVF